MKDPRGYLTVEQVQAIMDTVPNLRNRLILQIMYRCGRRVSEVLALRKEDILWQDKRIIFTILKRKRPIKEIKPVDEDTMKLLELYVNNPGLREEGIRKTMSGNVLFPITRQQVFKLLRKVGKEAGIETVGLKRLHPHHMRHSFAVHQVRSRVKTADDLRKLQMYMGHANLNTTAHYLQYSPDELRDLVDGMWGPVKKKEEKPKNGS